jgi:DNA polymerase
MGKIGWVDLETYGGKLTENVVQAVARDILANAIINLEDAGYPVVLHVHDEIIAEVPRDTKSLEEFEQIMSKMPDWAHDWPVKAQGGWRGERYRK